MNAQRLWLPVAAAVGIATMAIVWYRHSARPFARLSAAVPRDHRLIEPRITGGFDWAPVGEARRDAKTLDPRQYALFSVAAGLLDGSGRPKDGTSEHAAAVAHLLTGNVDHALRFLGRATDTGSATASEWNDLGVAHYVAARGTEIPEHLEEALAAVEQALRLDREHEEALFNRAVILERLAIRPPAAEAWRDYLAVHPDGAWADEARNRLSALSGPVDSAADVIEREYASLISGDAAAASRLLAVDAGEARRNFQAEVLGRWGESWLNRDMDAAARHLAAARTFGTALRAFNGEAVVAESVAAIDRGSDAQRDILASGHVGFREGRRIYTEQRQPAKAEAILTAASRNFAAGGSPMEYDARVYTAVAVFGQNRTGDAEAILRQLESSVPPAYPALRAYIKWQQASCFMARAEWGRAIDLLNEAIVSYEQLREPNNAAYLHDIVAQAYAATGDRKRAGRNRIAALQELGLTMSYRLQHAVGGIVYDAIQRRDWRVAAAFERVQASIARHVADKELRVDVLLSHAFLSARLGDSIAAESALLEASNVAASVSDAALREKLQSDCTAAAALTESKPSVAIERLTSALAFHERRGWRMLLPNLYLRRGRMWDSVGESRRAAADYESGIGELERHRESLPEGELRWGVLDAAEELFTEAIEVALRTSVRDAFRYAERKRARSLTDAQGAGFQFDFTTLAADTVVVEYAVLPKQTVMFAATRDGITAEVTEVPRETIETVAAQLKDTISDVPLQNNRMLRRAYELLFGSVETTVRRHRRIVFVPDAITSGMPLAVLINPVTKKTIVDDYVVSFAPSAGAYQQSRSRHDGAAPHSVLVIDSARNDDFEALPGASAEARAIASMYPVSRRISGDDATPRNVVAELGAHENAVVHFATHAISSGETAALVLTASEGDSGRLDTPTISRIRLPSTPTVVLASCESAGGPVRAAEGTMSVAWAFLHAGAGTVIATSWPIGDRAAAEFFPRLHRHLATGVSPAEAVRLAQLEAMRTATDDVPLWASVQAIGY